MFVTKLQSYFQKIKKQKGLGDATVAQLLNDHAMKSHTKRIALGIILIFVWVQKKKIFISLSEHVYIISSYHSTGRSKIPRDIYSRIS